MINAPMLKMLETEIERLNDMLEHMGRRLEAKDRAINEAINSLAAIGQTDNAAYRKLKSVVKYG